MNSGCKLLAVRCNRYLYSFITGVYLTEATIKLMAERCPHLKVLNLHDAGYLVTDHIMELLCKVGCKTIQFIIANLDITLWAKLISPIWGDLSRSGFSQHGLHKRYWPLTFGPHRSNEGGSNMQKLELQIIELLMCDLPSHQHMVWQHQQSFTCSKLRLLLLRFCWKTIPLTKLS